MKVCKEHGEWVGQDGQCIGTSDPTALSQGGLPYLIIAIALILCALLLATIVLVIVILVYRKKKQGIEDSSPGPEPKISFGALEKPLTGRAVEIQPDLSNLEPRLDQRAYFMQYGQLPQRRFVSLPMEAQRRLIPVPEEEGDADLNSPDGQYTIDQAELELATGIQDWVQEYEPMISKERPK